MITVLLADDHAVVRAGLRALLEGAGDMHVVGEAENGREAIALAERTRPEVVLMDVAMPHLNGYEATRHICRLARPPKVLVLSSFGQDENIRQMLEAGAAGYVLKQSAAADLLDAIRAVHAGRSFFSPEIARRFSKASGLPVLPGLPRQSPHPLSPREREVVQLVAEGFSNKMIAAEIGISIKTVEKHRQQAMDKLQIHDVAGLTRYALAVGIIDQTSSAHP